jgi:uncharacterized protein YdiU (UPF0061 family)
MSPRICSIKPFCFKGTEEQRDTPLNSSSGNQVPPSSVILTWTAHLRRRCSQLLAKEKTEEAESSKAKSEDPALVFRKRTVDEVMEEVEDIKPDNEVKRPSLMHRGSALSLRQSSTHILVKVPSMVSLGYPCRF